MQESSCCNEEQKNGTVATGRHGVKEVRYVFKDRKYENKHVRFDGPLENKSKIADTGKSKFRSQDLEKERGPRVQSAGGRLASFLEFNHSNRGKVGCVGSDGGGLVVGSSCFVAAIFSMKNETAIGGKHRVARGMLWREMRRNNVLLEGGGREMVG